ncbi:hypothetical protein DAPPUDRAFT_117293 [Daphnia pulex]|uniref:Uncharacterized protein n=1 Tax=Daphnia pulex TaxID=6669 RepID=E9HS64_DAPPU|nr:hypothetical protein DAPPUDRAFT_117293 [Daphnia pulex]|eukprot:EFX65387.1 hypothetical protein DAPPUDRAFT_117293 [Daphnia pulex]
MKSSSASSRQRHFYDEVQLALLDAEFTRDPISQSRSGGFRIAVDVHANLDLHESRHQLVKQIATIVDQRLTFLVKVDKILTPHLKSFLLLDSIRILRQFHPWNQSTTRRPNHHCRLHFNPNGLLPAVHKTSLVPSPISITRMNSERISNHSSKTNPPTTGRTRSTHLLSIQLL